jgi:hypothetical protein
MYACAGTVFAISVYELVNDFKSETSSFVDDSMAIEVFAILKPALIAVNVRLLDMAKPLTFNNVAEHSWRYYYSMAGLFNLER